MSIMAVLRPREIRRASINDEASLMTASFVFALDLKTKILLVIKAKVTAKIHAIMDDSQAGRPNAHDAAK